ncbi:hypothetical protein O0I10_011526 [Lichtheimia ornata]|uniref:Uncharacterized protein n=1 Tax=Lichtheimia ornata TaxID=688661 RepID=A0AAD7XWP9_9FUNG|nr:uncharacterized protein O0I10_011526 [Lichtheimia ornata]KAJ8652852.1 hypothetical protein O0I10_011526 [Lichtheimia ornata]
MKFSSLLVVFTGLLLSVVSAARYPAILEFQPSPDILPRLYFTEIVLPTIRKTIRVNLWQLGKPQDLTEAYLGRKSRGYVEVDDISAFNGRYLGLVNDDTESLQVKIHHNDGQTFSFIGASATENPVTNLWFGRR